MATFKERLQAVDSSISTSLENDIQALKSKGVDVPVNTTHGNISELIESIQTGGISVEPNIAGGNAFKTQINKLSYWITNISFVKGQTPPSAFIDISLKQNGSVKAWVNGSEIIISSNDVIIPDTCHEMFYQFYSVTTIDFSNFSIEATTDMSRMFCSCNNLKTLIGIENWNVEHVTSMKQMFSGCGNLEALNLSNFSVQSLSDVTGMFEYCEHLTTIYASNWSSERKINDDELKRDMFMNCSSLVGATKYDMSKTSYDMANYETGYFKDPNKIGKIATINIKFTCDGPVRLSGAVVVSLYDNERMTGNPLQQKVVNYNDGAIFEIEDLRTYWLTAHDDINQSETKLVNVSSYSDYNVQLNFSFEGDSGY